MITNQLHNGWEVILHRAHALLAGRIGHYWAFDDPPAWLWDTLAAIVQHDDHVLELETPYLTQLGYPEDFRLLERFCPEVVEHQVFTALHRGRWVALMTSMHFCFILKELASEQEAIKQFLDSQLELQREWLSALPYSRQDAEEAYFFLRFCDRLSLILSCREIPEKGRRLEICGNQEVTYFLREVDSTFLTVEPWPFRVNEFSLQLECRILATPEYQCASELQRELRRADIIERRWKLVRMAVPL